MKVLSRFEGIMLAKCPRCRRGDLFTHRFYNITRFRDMPERCPVCGLRYEKEPGFFWGAMYVSYALTVGLCFVLGFGTYYVFGDPDMWVYAVTIVPAIIFTSTITFRFSRVIMLYYLSGVRFDRDMATKKP